MLRHEDSVAAYTRALELDASRYVTQTNRGEQLLVLGRTTEAIAGLSEAIRLGATLEARALLALAVRKVNSAEAKSLCREALEFGKDQEGKDQVTDFRRGEVRAWAHLILGDPDAAEAEMRAAAAHHQRDDLFIDEQYDLLADVPGIERLRAIWEGIR